MDIKLVAKDEDGDEINCIEHFSFLKEARLFVKEAWLTPDYWDRCAEIDGYNTRIYTIQLWKRKNMWDSWECVEDWFPKFHESNKKV